MFRRRLLHVAPEIAAGAFAAAAVLVYLRGRGVDLSPDSISYLAAADQTLVGKGLCDFQGDPLVLWPPLYPLALAGASRFAGDVVAAGAMINALAQGLMAALVVHWWRRLGVGVALLAAGGLILAVNRVTLHTVGYLWSEPLYGLFCLAAITVVGTTKGPVPARRALIAGLLAGAAWSTKYLGAAAATAVSVTILVANWRTGKRRAWALAVLAAAVAAIPVAMWMLRNLQLAGTPTGPRAPGPGFSLTMVLGAWRVLSRVFLSGVLSGPVVAGLVILGLIRLPASPAVRRAALAAGALLVAHTATLTASVSTVAMDGIGRRFMQPVVAPAVFLAILLLDRQRQRWTGGPRIVAGLGLLLAVYPVLVGVPMLRQGRPVSDGDRAAPALGVPADLRDGPWYSNEPLQVYRWYRRPVSHPPAWQRNPTVAFHPTPDRWVDLLRARGGEACFLWVGPRDAGRLAVLQDVPGVGWQEVGADSLLVVYRLRTR